MNATAWNQNPAPIAPPAPIPQVASRWTLALTLAARKEGRDFRGAALSGDAPAHLDPNQIGRAANDTQLKAVPQPSEIPPAKPRGAWPFRRPWF